MFAAEMVVPAADTVDDDVVLVESVVISRALVSVLALIVVGLLGPSANTKKLQN